MNAVKHRDGWGVPARRLAVALSAASPRAGYRAAGFALRSLTRKLPFLYVLLVIGCTSCTNSDFRAKPIAEFLTGAWVMDSTNQGLRTKELPLVRLLVFQKDGSARNHFFSYRHNKEYVNDVTYEVSDSSFNYADESWDRSSFRAGYRLERLDPDRFRLVAKFPVTNVSEPEMDSVIWYSRVTSAEDYLRPIMASNKAETLTCDVPDTRLIQGYWKMDSTESISRFDPEKYYYTYFDTSGTTDVFWLGSKPYHKSSSMELKGKYLVNDRGDSTLIRCLDDRHLVIGALERKGSYEAVYFTRIQPDTIIPDSLRVDRSPRKP